MNGAITWEQIAYFSAVLGGLIGAITVLWTRIENARRATRIELTTERNVTQGQIDNLRSELTTFRIRVAENYATYEAIKNLDERIGGGLDSVQAQIADLRTEIMKMAQRERVS